MTAKDEEKWARLLAGKDPSMYLEPEKVPDWNTLPYPDLDTVKTYASHPKPYTWPHFDRIHTFAHDYRTISPRHNCFHFHNVLVLEHRGNNRSTE